MLLLQVVDGNLMIKMAVKDTPTLLGNKLKALTVDNPDRIVTANIGCQMHLETKSPVPVQHWIELLDQ